MTRSPTFTHLSVVEPRPSVRERHRRLLARKRGRLDDIHYAANMAEALDYALNVCGDQPPRRIFLIGGHSFLQLFDALEKVHAKLPGSRIMIALDTPCPHCAFLADRQSIHGCCSVVDGQTEVLRGLTRLGRGGLVVSGSMTPFLDACMKRGKLIGKEEHRDLPLYTLRSREFRYLRYRLAGGDAASFAEEMNILLKSSQNIEYSVKGKLRLDDFSEAHRHELLSDFVKSCGDQDVVSDGLS